MRKLIITLSMAAISHINMHAQFTAEAGMALLPELPSVAEMIAYENGEGDGWLYNNYREALNEADSQYQEMLQSANPMASVKEAYGKKKITGTNVTIDQAEHMSDAQLKALGQKAVAGQLAKLGVSMEDLEAVQSGKMTEEELANRMMAKTTGGLTVKDVNFMKDNNMSAEEAAQFMQMAGVSKGVQAAAAKGQKAAAKSAQLAPLLEKIDRLMKKSVELKNKPSELRRNAKATGEDIYNQKYKKAIDAIEADIAKLQEEVSENDPDTPAKRELIAKQEQLKMQMDNYYKEYLPIWHDAIVATLNVLKNEFLPLERDLKKTYVEMYKLTGDPQYDALSKVPETAAEYYLSAARYIDWYKEEAEKL